MTTQKHPPTRSVIVWSGCQKSWTTSPATEHLQSELIRTPSAGRSSTWHYWRTSAINLRHGEAQEVVLRCLVGVGTSGSPHKSPGRQGGLNAPLFGVRLWGTLWPSVLVVRPIALSPALNVKVPHCGSWGVGGRARRWDPYRQKVFFSQTRQDMTL